MKSYKRLVSRIIDGDTFEIDREIKGIKRIRVADVNTPEIGEKDYERMTKFLEKLLLHKKVKLVIKSKNPPKGKYQARWVCYVYFGFMYTRDLTLVIRKELEKTSLWEKLFGN